MVLHRSRKPGPYGHPGSIPGGGVSVVVKPHKFFIMSGTDKFLTHDSSILSKTLE